jgi:hypothetical protein
MLDNLGGVTTFRCGGCGRALKVPAQFRDPGARATGPGSRPPSPGDATQAMPRVSPGVSPGMVAPAAAAATGQVAAAAMGPVAAAPIPAPGGRESGVAEPTRRSPIAVAGDDTGTADPPLPPVLPGSVRTPMLVRLGLWVVALPLGTLLVFLIASSVGVLTKSQLEDTFLLTGWGRFLPIARILPFCALATALLVQLGVLGFQRLRARRLQGRPPGRSGPGGGTRRGPTRPHAPSGQGQRPTNGARSRERAAS